ncbi:hypothetical protein DO97_03160 [Neosynechococcus sphagnicola sy1]|uniref:DUF554 domain-containing protein n=1 Tax=Neosynechococcus sphagnicola sy1 TaxID=1497020 RepID=A0A098TQD8_9CYAN|nr:DUF554 domain-containing protein [Neosynechococcus sphagnicola]KGF73043.1 hypothetical protein DO97_03160 [Neosynechococcus sphagnicola sy1]
MVLELWQKTSGTWFNVLTVISGTALGLCLQEILAPALRQIITQGVGLITLFVGFTMAGNLLKIQTHYFDGMLLGLVSMLMGGLLGEWWQIEARLRCLGEQLKGYVQGYGSFTEGFVTASLLFCVGPMALLGCLNNGLTGDSRLLTLKATMDGFAAIALSSRLGVGVGFSGVSILLYQGGLSLAAGFLAQFLPNPTTDPRVLLSTGVGGLMIVGLGLTLLDVAPIRVASFLPSLLLAPLLYHLATGIG